MRTKTKNYSIKYDGTVEVEPEQVPFLFVKGLNPNQINVTYYNDDIEKFNIRSEDKIELVSDDIRTNNLFDWNIPQKYLELDLEKYVKEELILKVSQDAYERRISRLENELAEIKRRKLESLFRCIIYVVDEMRDKKLVWGVGRGSSCASYILYLIGLHCVDPVKYDIPMSEFYHD